MKNKNIVWVVKDRVLIGLSRDGTSGYKAYSKTMQESTVSEAKVKAILKGSIYYKGQVIKGYKPKAYFVNPSIFIESLVDTSLPMFALIHFKSLSIGYTRQKQLVTKLSAKNSEYLVVPISKPISGVPNVVYDIGMNDKSIVMQMAHLSKIRLSNIISKYRLLAIGSKIGDNKLYLGVSSNGDFSKVVDALEKEFDGIRIFNLTINPTSVTIRYEDMRLQSEASKKYRKQNNIPTDEYAVFDKVIPFDADSGVLTIK